MRLLIAVLCIFLGGCSLPLESLAPTAKQATEPEESETCANLSELTIGMTTLQVLSLQGTAKWTQYGLIEAAIFILRAGSWNAYNPFNNSLDNFPDCRDETALQIVY